MGLVAPNRRMRNEYKILIGFGDLGVNERMILKFIIKEIWCEVVDRFL